MKINLIDIIGEPALLEQTAEECQELAFACLKLARLLRGENKVYNHTEEELRTKIEEEYADIFICYGENVRGDVIDIEEVSKWQTKKIKRMLERINELEV